MIHIARFTLFLGIIGFIYWYFIPPKRRSLFLLICSIFLIACFSIIHTVYFIFNIFIVYITGAFLKKEYKNKKLLLSLILIWLISNLVFLKYFNLFNFSFASSFVSKIGPISLVFPLGFSFIVFRLIHYIVEVYKKNISEGSFVDLAHYTLFFPTFLAGPIERFPKFYSYSQKNKNLNVYDINYGLWRIILGMVKKVFIADNLLRLFLPIIYFPEAHTRMIIISAFYALTIQVYMDFSGYTDIAIGISRLFGYEIIENFNKPFLQKNIALIFRNWHISLYTWIRDYFFFPIFGHRTSRAKIYIGTFITLIVFCLWHRATATFLLLGIFAGVSLVIWQFFQELKRNSILLRKLVTSRWFNLLSWLIIYHIFALSVPTSLYIDGSKFLHIMKYIFLTGHKC